MSPAVPTVRIYFRVIRGRRGFYSAVIRWYSRSPYTHAEFCWPLDNPKPPEYLGAQPHGGVAIRLFSYLGDQPYDTFGVDVTSAQMEQIRSFLLRQIGKPYDFRAIAGMVFPHLDRGKTAAAFFCSELVFYAFGRAARIHLLRVPSRESDRITPRDIAVSTVATPLSKSP